MSSKSVSALQARILQWAQARAVQVCMELCEIHKSLSSLDGPVCVDCVDTVEIGQLPNI